jgi:hypothetical protein
VLQILLVVTAYLMTVVTSAFDGTVLCRTGDGHTAIESPHAEGGCSGHEATGHSDEGGGPSHGPCDDLQVQGQMVRQDDAGVTARALELSAFPGPTESLACSCIPHSSSCWFNTGGQPPGVGDLGRLSSVVLLN